MRKNDLRGLFVLFAALAFFVAGFMTADAQTYGGRSTGINAVATVNGNNINQTINDTGQLPGIGGNLAATVSTSVIPGVGSTGVMFSNTTGALKSSLSSSIVQNLDLALNGVRIRADRIAVNAGCICCPAADIGSCSASIQVNALTITDTATGAQTTIQVTGQPNQVVNIPNGTLTINQQTTGPGSISVTGLRVQLASNGNTYDVRVANAASNLDCLSTAPTPSMVTISGRVLSSSGGGISRANVTLTNGDGVSRTVTANSFGSFSFSDVQAGQTYVLQASHRSYAFQAQVLNVTDDMVVDVRAQN